MSAPLETAALVEAVERVGDRWSLLIIHALLEQPGRFNELQERVSGISPNVLSERLKRLEADGIVLAIPYSERPPRFAYELTSTGRDLAGALQLLGQWGATRGGEEGLLRHQACGTPAEVVLWCPTCGRPIDGEASDLHHL